MQTESKDLFDVLSGMVYFTVASQDSVPGAIKRAYIPSVDDGSNNIGAAVDLGIKYITRPDGIAVDWVGRCVILYFYTDSSRKFVYPNMFCESFCL